MGKIISRLTALIRKREREEPITFRELLGQKYFPARRHPVKLSFITYHGRFRGHEEFLRRHKVEIRIFADIGCALPRGAPTTIDARKALGSRPIIYAIDVPEAPPKDEAELRRHGIEPFLHSIANGPLPFLCDAIRFANVSEYMSPNQRRKAIVNIWRSIKQGGYLLCARSLGIERGQAIEREFYFKKKGRGFVKITLQ